ncbi:AbrB/MazE/SpoVT family DNA-binding domain-containing protein [Pseudomonas mohnii]
MSPFRRVLHAHNAPKSDGGAFRTSEEALHELQLDAGDSLYLVEEFVGNTRCLVLSTKPQIAGRIDELTAAWDIWH